MIKMCKDLNDEANQNCNQVCAFSRPGALGRIA